ncbi:diguanylate cyclase [Chitinimonas sp. JJ19]|uniref:diguanylate cyclase n=1 Tax=Chitinimonas sp. JJ19 TaxID=3109352 RepID=UPI003002D639
MESSTRYRLLQAGFVLALLLLALTALVPMLSANWVNAAASEREEIVSQLEDMQVMLSGLKDAETGTRGYLLTGREEYLQPYYQGTERSSELQVQLDRQFADDAILAPRMRDLRNLVKALREYQSRMITSRQRSSAADSPAFHDISQGKLNMDRIRVTVAEASAILSVRQASIAAEQHSRERLVSLAVLLITSLDGALFATLLWQLFRAMRERLAVTQELQALSDRAQSTADNLEEHNYQMAILSRMSSALQVCVDSGEFFGVVGKYAHQLFPEHAGAIYVYHPSRDLLERMVSWLSPASDTQLFEPLQCWAIRRGQIHEVSDCSKAPVCQHLQQDVTGAYLCLPLMAGGEPVGILYLEAPAEGGEPFSTGLRQLANALAEQVALAVTNMNLRENLRRQSIVDALTGLYNRRFLDETLQRELIRANRLGTPLSVVMLDVDHFKRFNDTHGHEAGDLVLRHIAQFMQKSLRGSDLACRFGGEEFTLIMPETTPENAQAKCEELREQVSLLTIRLGGKPLPAVTISMGIASTPQHGERAEELIQAADAALYQAKHHGRNRVEVAGGEGAIARTSA